MRIAMLSWRDPANPAAGGAEVLTDAVVRRLAEWGHSVVWFAAGFEGGAPYEVREDGVTFVRRGRQWSVHVQAYRWLRGRLGEFDRVVDQINTIPFLTPLYVDAERRRFFIHQLAREYWFRETRGPFRAVAPFGYAAEPLYLRAYGSTSGVTVSDSSRDDLVACGIPAERVTVVPQVLTAPVLPALEDKPGGPLTIAMVSRLTPAKFFEEGLDAFRAVRAAVPGARLRIAGSGDPRYRERLERHARETGIAGAVEFLGRVPEDERQRLLRDAHVHLFCSHREGWGLVVSEAAAAGTPSVGYDAPGVRDSVGDPGLLAPIGDTAGLAARVLELWSSPERYAAVREAAWRRAGEMSVDRTARAFAEAIL